MGENPKPNPLPCDDPDGWRVQCELCGALTTDTLSTRCGSCFFLVEDRGP